MSRRGNNNSARKEPRIVEGRMNDSDDDEEIDEDGAFNSEDELMYGSAFSSSYSSKKKKKKKEKKNNKARRIKGEESDGDDDEDGSDDEDDDESDEDGSDENDDSDGSDESDESDENDWAGSSDDSDGGEDNDDDGGRYMLDLLNNLDGQHGERRTRPTPEFGGRISLAGAASEAATRMPEDEHRSGSLSAMMSSGASDGGGDLPLTLDSLMGSIADTSDYASVQKSMRSLSSGRDLDGGRRAETTPVPVSRIVSDRASRRVHYKSTTEDVSRWTDAVHEGRDAETLDFRTNGGGGTTNRLTRDALVEKFEASNDFEREIRDALERAGMADEERMARRERMRLTGEGGVDDDDDDLGSNVITAEEYKKRHGELAKMRALMFYEEQKRHRINKIKSKKYRKIRKRQRERLKDGEDEAARLDGDVGEDDTERIEREEMDRMRERMTLAHKNTSKWARHMLRRGSKMDVEERRALSLQIAKGEELRRKAMGGGRDEEDGEIGGTDDETEGDLLERARDILMETRDDDLDDGDGKRKKGKGLFQLEFMKRGMEAQRARAKEEARRLLEELEANESDDGDVDDYDVEERKSSTTGGGVKKKTIRVATEAETNEILPGGKLVASSLLFGRGDGFAIKVDGSVELGGNGDDGRIANDDAKERRDGAGKTKRSKRRKSQGSGADGEGVADDPTSSSTSNGTVPFTVNGAEEEENPWIVSKSTKRSSKPPSRTVKIDEAASMLVDGVGGDDNNSGKRKRDDEDVSSHKEENGAANEASAPPVQDKDIGIADLSQAELVRRAFAAPADLEAEAEFEKEKERMKERDDPTRKKKEETVVSGWGSWAGAGAPPPRKQRKLPPKLSAPTSKMGSAAAQPKRKDDGMSTVIINEKRLKKTAKFQLSEIPYPYRSREEYERAISGSIGQEWNTIHGTKEMSRPAILFRAGKIIQPIAKKAKKKVARAPAKF